MASSYLLLGEVLAVVGTRGGADVVEPTLKLGSVALDEGETELKCLVGVRRASQREASGSTLEGLVDPEVASSGLAQGKGEKGSEEQGGCNHGDCGRCGV